MANLKTENQFVTAVVEEQLPIKTILRANFESTWLTHHGDIWDWLLNYYQTNNKLPSKELLQTRYPAFQVDTVKDNPAEILDALREGSKGDRIYQDINEAVTLLQKPNVNPDTVIAFLETKLQKYNGIVEQDVFDLTSEEDAAKLKAEYEERKKQLIETGHVGIPTGMGTEMDTWLNGGLQKGNLYGVLAPLGTGKTWIAQIMAASALRNGFSPFILALEGTLEKEGYRTLTTVTELSNSRLHTATAPDMDFDDSIKRLRQLAEKFNGHYYLALHGNRTVYTPTLLRQNLIKYLPDIAIVDYPGLMGTKEGTGADEWAEHMAISRGLKRIAVSLNIPIVATMQGNRASTMAEFLQANDASNFGPLRDYDGVFGMTVSQQDKRLVRIGGVKGRDTQGDFRAYYQSDWDRGKILFKAWADDGDSTF